MSLYCSLFIVFHSLFGTHSFGEVPTNEIVKHRFVSLRKEFQVVICYGIVYDVECVHEGSP
jgi:hypothetical protein